MRDALHRWCLAAALTAVAAWARTSAAQPVAGVALQWAAPAGCPGSDDVRARIRHLLPAETTGTTKEPLLAEGTVVTAGGRYRLTLHVHQDKQPAGVTRSFESDSCASLAGAAAVTLALLARDEAAMQGGTTSTAAVPAAPVPPSAPTNSAPTKATSPAAVTSPALVPTAAPPTSPRSPNTAPPTNPAPATAPADTPPAVPARATPKSAPARSVPRRPWGIALEGPVASTDEGALPSWAVGLGLAAGLRLDRTRLMLGGRIWLPQNTTTQSVYEVRYTRWSGSLSGCYGWPAGQLEIGPCATATLENVTAKGTGPQVSAGTGRESWLALSVAARASWAPARWVSVFVRPSLTFHTARPIFVLDGVATLYQVPLATVGIDLGCEWIF